MGLLDTFFDPTERQRRKLEGLRTKRSGLVAEHAAAVAAGDDAVESKAWAALGKLDTEIRGAEAAAAIADQQAARAKADSRTEAQRLAIEAAEQATQHFEAKAVELERKALALAPAVRELEKAYEGMRAAREAAGVSGYVNVGGFTVPDVWNRALIGLGRAVHRLLPRVSSWSTPVESVEELLARKGSAARPWRSEDDEKAA